MLPPVTASSPLPTGLLPLLFGLRLPCRLGIRYPFPSLSVYGAHSVNRDSSQGIHMRLSWFQSPAGMGPSRDNNLAMSQSSGTTIFDFTMIVFLTPARGTNQGNPKHANGAFSTGTPVFKQ